MTKDTLPLYIVDAFANEPFRGNPAAVVPLEVWPEDSVLQSMAMEHNLSETAFFAPSFDDSADYEIRWFTPTVEVPLCGHATLASGHVIFHHLGFQNTVLRLKTREKGVLTLKKAGQGSYEMTLPTAEQTVVDVTPDISEALGLTVLEAYRGEFLLLVLPRAEAVASYQPDFDALAKTGAEVIITAKGGEGPYKDLDFVSRMFAPTIGINEDPVTGAAHAQLTPYWSLVLQKTDMTAAQIGPRRGDLQVSMQGNTVMLTGEARTYASGHIFI